MKKKLANLLFMVTVALQATAQITILSMDDVKKSEPIDELVFRAQYELKMVEDTTKTDCQPNSETMMLEVGKKCSQFYSYTTYLRDSTLIADYANKVSQDILQQHAKAYGNGRITYRIYKNYPTGKVTTLDRLATSNFRCEEKNEKPVWTLLPDTATILTYHCRKATCHFRGRSYMAWFTMEIPVSEGPWKLCGLPGLIIKAEDDRRGQPVFKDEIVAFDGRVRAPPVPCQLEIAHVRYPCGCPVVSFPDCTPVWTCACKETVPATTSPVVLSDPVNVDAQAPLPVPPRENEGVLMDVPALAVNRMVSVTPSKVLQSTRKVSVVR